MRIEEGRGGAGERRVLENLDPPGRGPGGFSISACHASEATDSEAVYSGAYLQWGSRGIGKVGGVCVLFSECNCMDCLNFCGLVVSVFLWHFLMKRIRC